MRNKFNCWLKSYKEYNANKVDKIIEIIDRISDNLVKEDILSKHIFVCETFVEFAKLRRKIVNYYPCNNQEKNAFNLFADFLEIMETSNYPLPKQDHTLEKYCSLAKMTHSYKILLIRGLIHFNWRASVQDICEYFIEFYSDRIRDGKIAEKEDSIFSSKPFDIENVRKVILNNVLEELKELGIILYDCNQLIVISSKYCVVPEDVDRIDKLCVQRLLEYYKKINKEITIPSEVEYALNTIQNSLDNVGNNIDLKKCEFLINSLKKELVSVYAQQQKNENNVVSNDAFLTVLNADTKKIDEADERKVGKLVREEMKKLSEEGFVFSDEEIQLFMEKEWSKKTFNVNYPFFRKYNPDLPKNDQRKDHNGEGRYWTTLFKFGEFEYLITSEWYVGDRPYFIKWFNSRFSSM